MSQPEDRYPRHVVAVLVADVSGFSRLMGEDDERTARDVHRVRAVVGGIVADLHGQADPKAGDSICATFESVVAAVEAALRIQRDLEAMQETDRPLRLRIGVHFGDVLQVPEGGILGDAVNVAARLCALARPGTVCVSDGVYRHVRSRFREPVEDLGRRRLKNIADPVQAHLIVPGGTARAPRRWRPTIAAVLLGALGLSMIGSLPWLWRYLTAARSPAPANRAAASSARPDVTLGVMLFKPLREDPEHVWMREALRDGLNTHLSGLSKVKVYSKEFLDLLTTKQGLTEIEAANKLGITKMLSGSFIVVQSTLRIETHVVDVASGVLESAYTTTGHVDQFLTLQTTMVEGVIARLDLPITEEERRSLLAQENTDVEALRMLLEAEGGTEPRPPPVTRPDADSFLPRWLRTIAAPAPAWADDRADILDVIEQYRGAIERRDLATIGAVYLSFSPEQQAAQQRYFDNAQDLRIVFSQVEVVVVTDEAVVSYTRTDDFTDARTGRPIHVSVRLTKNLKRANGTWRLASK